MWKEIITGCFIQPDMSALKSTKRDEWNAFKKDSQGANDIIGRPTRTRKGMQRLNETYGKESESVLLSLKLRISRIG